MAELDTQCDALGATISSTLHQYGQSIKSDEERAIFDKIGPALESYRAAARKVRSASREGDSEMGAKLTREASPAFAAY